jgi:uncharacterized membrane protein YfcA
VSAASYLHQLGRYIAGQLNAHKYRMTAYLTINTIAEGLCAIASIFCLYRDKALAWRLFIPFMLLTVLVEIAGIYIRQQHRPNFMLYNMFLVVECAVQNYFFYYLYASYRDIPKPRGYLLIVFVLFFVLFFFAELVYNRFNAYVSVSSTILSVELILASVYFYYLLLCEEHSRRLSGYAPFWWVNGTICFYFAGIASNLFFNYLVQDHTHGINHSARYIVFSMLNIILYISWSYAFLCRYRQRISSY